MRRRKVTCWCWARWLNVRSRRSGAAAEPILNAACPLPTFPRKLTIRRTPCTYCADDRARRFPFHRTPCTDSVYDRARIFATHRTPCNESADDRARIFLHHRTPCTWSADGHADKRCTPCSSSGTSPRVRTAPLWEGLSSSASCPSSSTGLSDSRQHRHRRYPELQFSRVAATPSSSLLRAP